MRTIWLIVSVVAATACEANEDGSPGDSVVGLRPEVTIDGMEADLVPVRPIGVGVSATGVLAVGQPQDHLIRFYDEDATLIGKFGGEGSGPGEFLDVGRMGYVGDTLWVIDLRQQRITFVAPDRSLARTAILPSQSAGNESTSGPLGVLFAVGVQPDGNYLALGSNEHWIGLVAVTGGGDLLRVIADFTPFTVPAIRLPGGSSASAPLSNRYTLAVSGDGRWITMVVASTNGDEAGTYTVVRLTATGDTIDSRRFPFDPVPVSEAAFDSAVEILAIRLDPEAAASFRQQVDRPEMYPPLTRALITAQGTVWVGLRTEAPRQVFHIHADSGLDVKQVELSENGIPAFADHDKLWVLEPDANDVQSVTRYRIEPLSATRDAQ